MSQMSHNTDQLQHLHLLASEHLGVWHWTAGDEALHVSREWLRPRFDTPPVADSLKSWISRLRMDFVPQVLNSIRALQNSDSPSQQISLCLLDEHHQLLWLQVIASHILRGPDGQLLQVAGTVQDITLQHNETRLFSESSKSAKTGGWDYNVMTGELRWTPETYTIHGLRPGTSVELAEALTFYPPADRRIIEKAIQTLIAEKEEYALELRFITRQGRQLWVHTKGHCEEVDGEVVRIYGSIQDITAMKEAEISLRKSEDRFSAFLETIPHITWRSDTSARINYCNQSGLSLLGLKRLSPKGNPWQEYIHPDDWEPLRQHFEQDELIDCEVRICLADGGWYWHDFKASLYKDDTLEAPRWKGICTNIHKIKEAHRLIKVKEERVSSLINSSDTFILSLDSDYRITVFNKAFELAADHYFDTRLQGGEKIFDFMPPSLKPMLTEVYAKVMAGEVINHRFLLEFEDLYVWQEEMLTPIVDSEGMVQGMVIFSRSVDAEMQQQMEIEKYAQRLELATSAAGIGIWEYFPDRAQLQADKRTQDMLRTGGEQEQPDSIRLLRHVHPDDFPRLVDAIAKTNASHTSMELTLRYKTGNTYASFRAAGQYQPATRQMTDGRIVGVLIDETLMHQALQDANRLALVARHTDNGVVITDKQGYIEWNNEAFSRITGYQTAELLGKKPGELLQGPLTKPEEVEKIRERLANQLAVESELINYHKSGRPYWLQMVINPIFDEQGKVAHYISIQSDITNRKHTEKSLIDYQHRLRLRNDILNSVRGLSRREVIVNAVFEKLSQMVPDASLHYFNSERNEMGEVLVSDHFQLPGKSCDHFNEYLLSHYRELMAGKQQFVCTDIRDLESRETRVPFEEAGVGSFVMTKINFEDQNPGMMIALRAETSPWEEHRLIMIRETAELLEVLLSEVLARENQRKAEEMSRGYEAELFRARMLAKFGFWQYDFVNKKILLWSEEIFQQFGRDPAMGTPGFDEFVAYIDPEDRTRFGELLEDAIAQRSTFKIVFRTIGPNQTWISTRADLQMDEDNNPRYLFGTSLDITDLKTTERSLEQSNDRLLLATASAQLGIWQYDSRRDLFQIDERICNLLGLEEDETEMSFGSITDFVPENDRDRIRTVWRKAFEAGDPFQLEISILSRQGALRHLKVSGKQAEDTTWHESNQFYGTLLDETDRIKAYEDLQMSRNHLREAQYVAELASFDIRYDPGHKPKVYTYGFDKLLSIQDGSPSGIASIAKYFLPGTLPGIGRKVVHALITKQKEVSITHQSKDMRTFRTILRIEQQQQKPLHIIGTTQDITLLTAREEELTSSVQEKEVLITEVHHRVKNNLALICSMLYLQAESTNQPEFKEVLEESYSRIQSIAMVHERLYQTRDLAAIKIKNYFRELVQNILALKRNSQVTIYFDDQIEDLETNVSIAIPAGLVINELVTNSLKHAFPRQTAGTIRISFTKKHSTYMLDYQDDGIGLSEEVIRQSSGSLGFTLIDALTEQMGANTKILPGKGFQIIIENIRPHKGKWS